MTGVNALFRKAFQLSAGLGISVGAIALRIGQAITDGAITDAFPIAFLAVASVALLRFVESRRMGPAPRLHVMRRD